MKIKRYILTALIIMITVMFSACANVTYTVKLKPEGKVDVNVSVLYNNPETSYDLEKVEEVKDKFIEKGYKIKDINDKGLKGFSITKENIKFNRIEEVEHDFKADILSDVLHTAEYEKGFLSNYYDIDGTVDLTSYAELRSFVKNEGKVVSDDEYKKILSQMNLKLIVELEKGSITETNSTLIKDNKKVAEWVLIPGTKTEIELEAATSDKINIVGTIVIFSVVFLIAATILLMLFKIYLKKRKNNK